ncbi:MAG TPA: fumarylacetoacetate hydrolase family protein [Cyclobacteriaceae bacterium]|nr:fumarylacetoacetate hydrolase family protein [Cyclobacteriaceae bacterium]
MKLLRYGAAGKERPGIMLKGKIVDVSAFGEDYNEKFFDSDGIARLRKWVEQNLKTLPVLEEQRFGPPFQRPSKIICIGLNYVDHAREANMELPKEPVVFFKATSAMTGPNDPLRIPRNSVKTDWEVELAVVIGKKTSYVTEQEAQNCIAGYCLHNDYSEREFQLERGGQWVKGKSCDTFAPIGPFLMTPGEIQDVNNLKMWLKVTGQMMQDSNSMHLVFKIPFLISYLSQFMTLLPGDVISTGTPAGVGMGMKPPQYLKSGDVVELGIEGLGQQRQEVI